MTRAEAYNLMCEMIQNPNLRKHGLAVEVIMGSLCNELQNRYPKLPPEEFNQEQWAVVGLLHDADYEQVEKDHTRHTLVTEEKLREQGVENERIINGIKAHHEGIKPTRDNLLEKAIYCADELAGLIIAVALVRPNKKISSVTVEAVVKKFLEKSFAAGARREQIAACEKELGIPLDEFIAIALKSMQKIHKELGL